jgi:leucyl aminopeptidase
VNVHLLSSPAIDATADLLIVGLAKPAAADALAILDARLGGGLLAFLAGKKFEPDAGDALVLPTFGRLGAAQVAIVGTGDGGDAALRKAAGKIGALAREQKATTLAVDLGALGASQFALAVEQIAVGNYRWDRYQPADKRLPALAELHLAGAAGADAGLQSALIRARWQALCRDLVNSPAAEIYPETMAAEARKLAAIPHVQVEVLDFEACKARGMVGIVAVGQGSARPGCLIHVTYAPPGHKDTVAIVGKGVTFDSGGLSLKPSDAMQTMRCDMGGAATALAAIGCVAELGLPVRVDAFIPCVENMVSGDSYKLGDMLTYRNGVTVEIHNTDAEGRLILADALLEACDVPGVSRVVDLATLTGAILIALGTEYTGLFSAHDGLSAELSAAYAKNGELVWRMPLHTPYNRLIKGAWSPLKNVGGREGGSITAALYLQHFVKKDLPWAHLDIAGTAFYDGGIEPYAPGGTGQSVRTLVDWVAAL